MTKGSKSDGILAQSIGGGGGNGGFSIGLGGGSEFGGAVSVGGFGAGGGNGAAVTAKNFGAILTEGSDSNGIAAQSIGGGGGNGGFSIAGSFTTGSAALGVSVGGFGAGGGSAGSVEVDSYAQALNGVPVVSAPALGTTTLETLGDRSNGILAQSIGGGGGNGGFSGSGALSLGGAGIGVSVGGFGAGGGSASSVTVVSANNIVTLGQQSNGILAQSIGGGGGNGGFSIGLSGGSEFAGTLSVGGSALGGGGAAGAVKVTSYGTILTLGADSNAIAAQSIGGGGGNGGFSIAGAFTTGSVAVGLTVGGFGSTGSAGGTVTVNSYSQTADGAALLQPPPAGTTSIETDGDRSNAILAQSIGGGGGNGGFSGGLSASTSGGSFTASVGGFGAGGGAADAVSVTSYNNILTKGTDSNGVLAQSLGGGGGNGGFSIGLAGGQEFGGALSVGGFALTGGGNGGVVTVDSFGTVQTMGDRSNAIEAQSIGGSGGNGGFSLSGALALSNAGLTASIGGGGSGGGSGGAVTVDSNQGAVLADNFATIETLGQSANGIEAQSIGGGGGNGGFSGAFTATADSKASLSLSVGGFGGAGNFAGQVNVVSVDNILTHSDGSNGILAQSIGGGGGNGGFSFAGTISVPDGNSFTLSASLGGFGGSAGNAGAVDVASTGIISTEGANASGVVAQSLGGGGGNGGLSVAGSFNFASQNNVPSITVSVGGTGGAGGAGGSVNVTRIGATTTIGDNSYGILVQSIGGGGGNGGLSVAGSIGGQDSKQISASVGGFGGAGSSAGAVSVTNTGDITTGSSTMETVQLVVVDGISLLVPASTGLANTGTPTEVKVVTGRNADGILAQSIGGGGGNGGLSFSGAIGPTGENTNVNVGLTVGGFGGGGGTASSVNVTNVGRITTFGDQANGIAAQSIGGGGGNGGSAITGLLAAGDAQQGRAVNVAVSVGGFGGNGNTAGDVTVVQSGGIVTEGAGSNGILAQSIGGGGGTGGGANTISLQLGTSCTFGLVSKVISACKSAAKSSVNAQIDVGGFGGTGNDAGKVSVTNLDFIVTSGNASAGIMAQSIGGGGGNGGQAIVGLNGLFPGASYVNDGVTVLALATSTTGLLQGAGRVTLGGSGGASGAGAAVQVTNNGQIETAGVDSYGIFAQSVGGGGGIGGDASSGLTGLVSIGGSGGASGNGGDVTVTNTPSLTNKAETADILTKGFGATAIFAQSVGGGGGNGGTSSGLISLGGFLGLAGGGSAGAGGKVTVNNDAILMTTGILADGIFAQSVGGGGGIGGSPGLSILSLGGAGGSAGDGGAVAVNNSQTGEISTTGALSTGIFAQSVGGGGGAGGSGSGTLTVTVGGSGGAAGNGGTVNVANAALIETTGLFSDGVFAQSVGGGGGTGGGGTLSLVSVGGVGGGSGDGGAVNVVNSGIIVTTGVESNGVFAQSVGGSGGSAGGSTYDPNSIANNVTAANLVTIGRSGAGGGAGGAVEIDNSAIISTSNLLSAGLFAQSVGGGGGMGGGGLGALVIGGSGGASGNGGAVTIKNDVAGSIVTTGNESAGIIAQSVGGGGGAGGETYGLVAFAKNGSGGGNGGLVSVDNAGIIETSGQNSSAIFAQSVGGGGGYAAAANGLVADGGNAGNGGNGGAVVVNNTAILILTTGANSNGVFAQSVGGGGGVVNDMKGLLLFSGTMGGSGAAGNVTINQSGDIVATGTNSFGILAQSVGSTNGNITIAVNSGFIEGGSTGFTGVSFIGDPPPGPIGSGLEGGAGVGLLDGANNQLTISSTSTVTSVGRIDGFAITGTTGNDVVTNSGLVIGSVDLGGGANAFDNKGIFESGAWAYIGPGNLLTNEGLISPGDFGRVLTTAVTGNFLQTSTGIYGLDLQFSNQTADRINITGTASVTGTVAINNLNPGLALPGSHEVTILHADDNVTNHTGLTLEYQPSAVIQYSLVYPNQTDIDLRYAIDFSPGGLTINEHSVGYAINAIQTARVSPNFVPIATALFYQPTVAALGQTYDSLSGEGTSGAQQTAFAADDMNIGAISRQIDFWRSGDAVDTNGVTSHGDALSYAPSNPQHPAFGVLRDPRLPPPPRTWRAWFAGYGAGAQLSGQYPVGSEHLNYRGVGAAAGLDYQITPDILLGVSAGGGPSAFSVSNRATGGSVNAAHVAAYGAVRWNDFYASGIIGYDFFSNQEHRTAFVPGTVATLSGTNAPAVQVSSILENLNGSFGSHSVSGRFETGYTSRFSGFNVTPFVALQFASLTQNAYGETLVGGGPSELGLTYARRNVLSLPSFVGAQFDAKLALWDGAVLKPWLRLSWVHEFDPNRTILPSFISAPGFDFLIQGAQAARNAARLGTGFELGITREAAIFANFAGDFSNKSIGYGGLGGIKISW
ncbi:hypothetical protein [Methylocapsa acidiphila]|uniref:hypothetical protein n=1 Tax=Methylocapsa acidiphila TaxID=133552 RepID=UPI000420DE75|nr:hypothetical protein [Methylocapsa acidiphila]